VENSGACLHCALKSAQWSSPLHTESSIELLSVTCVFNAGIAGTHKAESSFQPLPNIIFTRLALKAKLPRKQTLSKLSSVVACILYSYFEGSKSHG